MCAAAAAAVAAMVAGVPRRLKTDALATLKTVSPAVHKYGTENTYVCTWAL